MSDLVGYAFPDGSYTVTPEENARLCALVDAPPLTDGVAHPIYAHLATHIGKGVTFTEYAAIVGAPLDAGYLYAGGTLEWFEPILVGREYVVRGGITGVEHREGRRTGRFDVVTTTIDLIDSVTDRAVVRSVEGTIVPRREAP
jgi:hypothetical protein